MISTGLLWLDHEFVVNTISSFLDRFETTIDYWRKEYGSLLREHQDLSAKQRTEKFSPQDQNRMGAISMKLDNMREGDKDFYSYRYLASRGFLPNYGFPSSSIVLSFNDSSDEIVRNDVIALTEFAPGNTIYFKGNKYQIAYARPKTQKHKPIRDHLIVCENCSAVLIGERAITTSVCNKCGFALAGRHPNSNAMRIPDMLAVKRTRITSDEEERQRRGYAITPHYEIGNNANSYTISGTDNEQMVIRYEHNGKLVYLNMGSKRDEADGQEGGFNLCSACNRWLFGEDRIEDHLKSESLTKCPKNGTIDDIIKNIVFFTEGLHDVVTITIPPREDLANSQAENFYTSIKEGLVQGIEVALNLDEGEMDGFISRVKSDPGKIDVIFFEVAQGGTGALKSLFIKSRFEQIISTTLELLHDGEAAGGCQKSCYDCLLNFYNQREHEQYDRNLILPFLRRFSQVKIQKNVQMLDEQKYNELINLCESKFEKETLMEIINRGLPLPDNAQKIIYEGDKPIAKADFFYKSKNIVVFVDGEAHENDYVSLDDERRRKVLESLGYRIFSVHYSNTEDGMGKLQRALE